MGYRFKELSDGEWEAKGEVFTVLIFRTRYSFLVEIFVGGKGYPGRLNAESLLGYLDIFDTFEDAREYGSALLTYMERAYEGIPAQVVVEGYNSGILRDRIEQDFQSVQFGSFS